MDSQISIGRSGKMTSRIESGQRIYDAMTDPTRICAQCIHVEVCTIFRGVNRALEWDFANIKRPFETPDIAKICNHFSRNTGV